MSFTRGRTIAAASVCIALLGLAGSAQAETVDRLRQAAEDAVRQHFADSGNRAVVQADKLDPRLQLVACAAPLKTSLSSQARPSARMAVQVICPGSWQIRVPVRLQLYRQVLVTVHPLQRGDGITAADVRSEERDITRLGYGYIDSLDQVADRAVAHTLLTGSVLTPAALGGRQTVRAGDHVQLIALLGGIEVRAAGVALGSGDTGARLRVRNDSSGKPVDAIVRGAGLVEALP